LQREILPEETMKQLTITFPVNPVERSGVCYACHTISPAARPLTVVNSTLSTLDHLAGGG
jgi:hypothetical protein